MEPHEKLSLAIAASDLRYASGSILGAGSHAHHWPFTQWGTMVAFEARKTLQDVHLQTLPLDWEDEIATAARHGGKFFDGKPDQIDRVVNDFRELAEATHTAFYPADRIGRAFDFLRKDLSVVTDGRELLLTNVTGHFMVGLPPDRGAVMDTWEPHTHALQIGIGQVTKTLLGESSSEVRAHGNRTETSLSWWDGDLKDVLPCTFGGELNAELSLAVISIYSTLQSARRWAFAECCYSCQIAALKHRFVVLHHAARSIRQLAARVDPLSQISLKYLDVLTNSEDLNAIVDARFRRLRNGWLHLGLGDVAGALPATLTLLSPVSTYSEMEISDFIELVERGLLEMSTVVGEWLMEPGLNGDTLFDHLQAVKVD
jgi:hypothetical protein